MHTPTSIHNFLDKHHTVTFSLGWSTAIVCLGTLQFGFHLAELNAPVDILSCKFHKPGPFPDYNDTIWSRHDFKQCIPMSEEGIALITTMFTVGGLVSSTILGSTSISTTYGRKHTCLFNALCFFAGSLTMTFANSAFLLNLGRFLSGLAAGSALIMSPILINELAPVNRRGLLGSLLQLAVTVGIFLAQVVSYFFSNDQQWRVIFLFASVLGLLQFVLLFTITESPKWMVLQGQDHRSATDILHTLRSDRTTVNYEINHWRQLSANDGGNKAIQPSETSALLEEGGNPAESIISEPVSRSSSRRSSNDAPTVTTKDFIFGAKYRSQFIAIVLIQTAQQLVGMNAIVYYGVRILNNLFNNKDSGSDYVLVLSCSFSFVNVLSAIAISPIVDRVGRKTLLQASIVMCGVCSLTIAVGIINQFDIAVITACFGFIIGFSIGLGPIPFLMISELASHEVVGIAQSIGTCTNWLANILIAFAFPILQNLIGGYVFYIFVVISVSYFVGMWLFVPETKGFKSSKDVWDGFIASKN
ncbi:hexose transporter of the major facilitator superfamily [Scheffersomyces xylosifermentans]|uniref:hexose transporter of the major facilitator superfamily n=1 Tax=Scheffersomyces xylosifermentans TaxID=1304137 RepID=UPI00315CC17F